MSPRCLSGRMRQHAAFDLRAAHRRAVGVKGSLRRAAPALDLAQTPNARFRYRLEIQERQNRCFAHVGE